MKTLVAFTTLAVVALAAAALVAPVPAVAKA